MVPQPFVPQHVKTPRTVRYFRFFYCSENFFIQHSSSDEDAQYFPSPIKKHKMGKVSIIYNINKLL